MGQMETRYSKEEAARRGDEIYEQKIRPQVEGKYKNQVVAIDIETGAYAIGDSVLEASKELSGLQEIKDVWFVRIGHRTLHRIAHFAITEKKK